MLHFSDILAFSHGHCIAICAVLVPVNILLSLVTLVLLGWGGTNAPVKGFAGLSSLAALIMVAHVGTWLWVGIVQIQTFVLLLLAMTCLTVDLGAIAVPTAFYSRLDWIGRSWLTIIKQKQPTIL
jgi:hypothetical protein